MKNLDKILNEAKNQNTPEFPFSNEEIRSFIKADDNGEIPSKPNKKGIIKMTIVSSAITAIIAIVMMLNNSNEATIPTIAKVNNAQSAIANAKSSVSNSISAAINNNNNSNTNATNSTNSQSIAYNNNSDESNNTTDHTSTNSDVQYNDDNSANNNQVTNSETPNTYESKQEIPDLAQASPKPNQEAAKPLPLQVNPKRNLRITMPGIDNEYLDSLEILILSDDELANINVLKTPCGYAFQAEEKYPKSSSKINSQKNREAAGYPDKGIARALYAIGKEMEEIQLVPYTNWDMDKTLGIYPFTAKHDYQQGTSSSSMSTSFGFTPLADDMIALVNENDDFYRTLIDSISNNYQNDLSQINSIMIYYDRDEYETFKSIIPIIMTVRTDSLTSISTLFYPASTNIIKLLPKRYNLKADDEAFEYLVIGGDIDKVKNEFQTALNTSENICKTAEPKKEKKPAPPIAGIEELILTAEEAKEIGIETTENGYEYYASNIVATSEFSDIRTIELLEKNNYNLNKDSLEIKSAFKFNKNVISESDMRSMRNEILNDTQVISNSLKNNLLVQITSKTSIITNELSLTDNILDTGKLYNSKPKYTNYIMNYIPITETMLKRIGLNFNSHDEFYGKDSLGNYRPVISNVLPVKFTLKGEINDTHIPIVSDYYLWFYIDKNFAMKLPERYRTPILRELEIMEQIKRGELPPEMACEALKGEKSYLGICTANNPEIKNLQVYPNPVTEKTIHVKFSLDKKTNLTIALYKPNGEFVDNLNEANREYNADNYWITFQKPNLENGVYMLSISDDNGNRAIRKIIVQN